MPHFTFVGEFVINLDQVTFVQAPLGGGLRSIRVHFAGGEGTLTLTDERAQADATAFLAALEAFRRAGP